MDAGDDSGFEAWVEEQAAGQPDLFFSSDCASYLKQAKRVLTDPGSLSLLSRPKAERVVWNMAIGIGQVLGEDSIAIPERVELARGIPSFFARFFGFLVDYSSACDIFWDVLISYSNPKGEMRDATFRALTEQLAIPNRFCQLSALHGFNHLRDRRCVPLITAFEKTTDDLEIRAYAAKAKMFMAM